MSRVSRLSREQLARISTDSQVIKFFESLMRGPPVDPAVVTVGASPFTYLPDGDGLLIVAGGTVSQVAYVRNATSVPIGEVAGSVPVLEGDAVTITYTVAPTVTFIPT